MNLRDIFSDLDGLYTATGTDWVFHLSHILTEPVCPTAVITPEGWQIARYRVDCNTIEESTAKVVALVRREIIERKVVGSYAPYTNPDDDVFAKWLHERAAGSDAKLPDMPCRKLPKEFEWLLDGFIKDHKREELLQAGAGYITARVNHYLHSARLDYRAAQEMVQKKLEQMKMT